MIWARLTSRFFYKSLLETAFKLCTTLRFSAVIGKWLARAQVPDGRCGRPLTWRVSGRRGLPICAQKQSWSATQYLRKALKSL